MRGLTSIFLLLSLAGCSESILVSMEESSDESVDNTPPAVTSVVLSPTSPATEDRVTATVTHFDAEDDAVTERYAWYVDGVLVAETGAVLDGVAYFDKHQEITVAVTPSDGLEDGAAVTSAPVVVVNTAPEAPAISITPAEPMAGTDSLLCRVDSDSDDLDDDLVSYAFQWDVDGVYYGSESSVPGADIQSGEVWRCTVSASDGEDDGGVATASTTAQGRPCTSASFNGTTSVITVEQSTEFDTAVFTAMFWVNLDGSQDGHLLVKGDNTTTEWSLTHSSSAAGQLFFNHQNVSNLIIWPEMTYGEWRHVAVTSDGSSVDLYVDGSVVGSVAFSVTPVASDLHIGNIGLCDHCSILGQMSQVAFFDAVLSEAEIQSIVGFSSSPSDYASIVGDWPLDEGSGEVAADASGSGHDGSLLDTTWSETCPSSDADGDGYIAAVDCDDSDADVYPYAGDDYGDEVDSDCDGLDCAADWHDTTYFAVCPDLLSWSESASLCQGAGYDGLASVLDGDEDSSLHELVGRLPEFAAESDLYWIGLNDITSEGEWRWSSGDSVTFTNWNTGEPNNAAADEGEDCGHLYSAYSAFHGGWNDYGCDNLQSYACALR